jgi:hypothetical protein
MYWLDYSELEELDSGEIKENLPVEVIHQWAVKAAESFDSLDILLAGIDSKISEYAERKAAIQKMKDNRKAFLLRYVSQLPDKELVVGVDKFKVIESTATKCEIADAEKVPQSYCKFTFTTDYSGALQIPASIKLFGEVKAVPDITKIKDDSKKGVEIAGTEIVTAKPSLRKNNKGV